VGVVTIKGARAFPGRLGLFTFDMFGYENSEKNKLTKVFCCRSKIRPRSFNTGVEGGRELRES
jgi:hypothetical protein